MLPTPTHARRSRPRHFASDVEKRNHLAELLAEAAEIEHDVMVQYLFAAFSMKQHPDEGGATWEQLEKMRRWKSTVLIVARQEMEHLGLVTNLLTAIGEAPNLRRPAFPLPARYYPMNLPSTLEPFGQRAVLRFVCFEMPEKLSQANLEYLQGQIQNFAVSDYDGIARTYAEIAQLFREIDPKVLFVGPPGAQFVTTSSAAVAARGMIFPRHPAQPQPVYDIALSPVTDRASAEQVIARIVAEGEGTDDDDPNSHFSRFLTMYRELSAEMQAGSDFAPARPVVPNPRTRGDETGVEDGHGTIITHPFTSRVSELFDLAYATMMLLLMRFFAHTDESADDVLALQNIVFFPMMTAVIRPLGELLTQLPAFEGKTERTAGPSFEFGRRVELLPHRKAAWRTLLTQLELMERLAQPLHADPAAPQALRPRLALVYETIARLVVNFKTSIYVGGKNG